MRQLSLVRAKGNTLMDIRLIATDLDGTLLDEEKKVPEENMAMLRKCVHPCSSLRVGALYVYSNLHDGFASSSPDVI